MHRNTKFLWISLGNRQQCEPHEQYSRSLRYRKISGYFSRFGRGVRDIGFSGELFLAALLSITMLVLQVVVLWFMMRACRIHLPLVTASSVFLILRLGTMIPNAPANVGTFQVFTVLGLTFFGVEKTSATAFSIVYFGALTVPLWALGVLAIAFSDLDLRATITSDNPVTERLEDRAHLKKGEGTTFNPLLGCSCNRWKMIKRKR